MRLVRHPGPRLTYTISDVSAVELGYVQLALISMGQPELRTTEAWVPARITEAIRRLPRDDVLELLADSPPEVQEAVSNSGNSHEQPHINNPGRHK